MQISKKLETIQLQEQINLLITEEINDKIKVLCRAIAKVEWSGVLFYKITEGSIKNASEMQLEVVDIFLMHKGTSGYTEYEFDGDIAEFHMEKMMADPETWGNIKIGHIHSHNTMSVFFSPTDKSELEDNCLNHNFYLSLIVNNFMDMTAKVAFKSTIGCYRAQDENGDFYDLDIELEKPTYTMFTYDCNIQVPKVELTAPEEFMNRLEYIIEKSDKEAEAKAKAAQSWKPGNAGAATNPANQGLLNAGNSQNKWADRTPFSAWEDQGGSENHIGASAMGNVDADLIEDETLNDMIGMNEAFLCYILRKGEIVADDTLKDTLEEITLSKEPTEAITLHIIDNYAKSYCEFFEEPEDKVVMEDLLDTLEANIENLEEEDTKFPWVKQAIKDLKEFSMRIEESWKKQVFK